MKKTLQVLALFLFTSSFAAAAAEETKCIVGATVMDGTGRPPIKDAAIVIVGARIREVGPRSSVALPPDAQCIDATGRFVIPGLADMHNHLFPGTVEFERPELKNNLRKLLGWGVTLTLDPNLDLRSMSELKAASAEPESPYPHFFGVGQPIMAKRRAFGGTMGVETGDEAREAVRSLKAGKVDLVKVGYDDMSWLLKIASPVLKKEAMAAAVEEAHQQGLKVYFHAPLLNYAKEALAAGADGLLHGIISDPVDDEFIERMKKNKAVYISTLALYEAAADPAGFARRQSEWDEQGLVDPEVFDSLIDSKSIRFGPSNAEIDGSYIKSRLPIARENLKRVFESGIAVVTGTDTGIPGVLLGLSSHSELILHVEAGLTPREALRAATIDAARMMGVEKDLGTVEPGKLADFLILDADPLENIRHTLLIHRVVKGGVIHDPDELREAEEQK